MEQYLFLTCHQAVTAICLDFRGYGPQPMLFCGVMRTLFGSQITYRRDAGKDGLWISNLGHGPMQWIEGSDLVERMCRLVTEAAQHDQIAPETLAVLCRQVFQTPCLASEDPDTGSWGVRLQTDMSAFECRQCGQCCRQLDYRDGISEADVARLKELGRKDVLEWVRPVRTAGGELSG